MQERNSVYIKYCQVKMRRKFNEINTTSTAIVEILKYAIEFINNNNNNDDKIQK